MNKEMETKNMFHHKIKRLAMITLFSIVSFNLIASAHWQEFRVEGAGLEAVPTSYRGPCPGLIKFAGKIQASAAGRVKYTFFRSDDGTGPEGYVDFAGPGVKLIETSWTLGGAGLTHYEGWVAIRILSPNSYESNHAKFVLDCDAGNEKQPNGQSQITDPATREKEAAIANAAIANKDVKEVTPSQQSAEKVSPIVTAGFQLLERDSDARTEARKKMFEAERARFEPTAIALADAVKKSGVDLDGFLSASKAFVELPPEKMTQAEVLRINGKYAEPIRTAMVKAVGVPGIIEILQGAGQPAPTPPPNPGPNDDDRGGPQAAACCSVSRFEPPYEGLYRQISLGASLTQPGETRQLFPKVRSAIASAPHMLESSGRRFTVPSNTRHVRVTVNLGTNWVIGLSGVGYAHVWLGLDMKVYDSRTALVCSAPHLEQDNQWTWTGGALTLFDHRPGPVITRTCYFDRNVGDPTEYAANVSASSDGTFIGASGGYGDYYVDLGPVDVTSCP